MQLVGAQQASDPMLSVRPFSPLSVDRSDSVRLHCIGCKSDLTTLPYHSLGQEQKPVECMHCLAKLTQHQGIWLALLECRQRYFARFMHDYELVREAEGRGSSDPEFYLCLPFQDRTGRNSWQWSIRSRTFRYFATRILPALEARVSRPLTFLDLGAGNGWLSYRLAQLGHHPIAVDLQTSSFDGLGAAIHYQHSLPKLFPRFQAELDRLPFANGQFDCAIFNASFHYSENYDRTLAETIRCLRPGGTIVIADSPSYSREEVGLQMVEERRKSFQKSYGFASDSLHNREYLTRDRLFYLETRHNLEWVTYKPWYGIRWACRPALAWARRRREPSQFRIYTAQVKTV
jgi:SAM-dependent methyltransferase